MRKRWAEMTKPWHREAAASAVDVALAKTNAKAGWKRPGLDQVVPVLVVYWAVEKLGNHRLLA